MDELDPTTAGLWSKVLESWEDDKRHEAFLVYCRESGRLDLAARCYRTIADGQGEGVYRSSEKVEEAKKRLGAIAAMAILVLESNRDPEATARAKRRLGFVAVLVFLGMLFTLAWALSIRAG